MTIRGAATAVILSIPVSYTHLDVYKRQELYGQGYKEYYTGMASGFNMTAAEAVLQVRERYEGIKLICLLYTSFHPAVFACFLSFYNTCL